MHGYAIKPSSNARCRREARRQWRMLRQILPRGAAGPAARCGAGGRWRTSPTRSRPRAIAASCGCRFSSRRGSRSTSRRQSSPRGGSVSRQRPPLSSPPFCFAAGRCCATPRSCSPFAPPGSRSCSRRAGSAARRCWSAVSGRSRWPGATGGVASAVITGKRGTMPEEVKQAFRDSGLSHLLAIAGLHLGLVGGFVFFTVRGGLALIPWVALRYPIKKITALVTLIVLFCYLMISGAAIPTQRAFVMTGIVFVAGLSYRLRSSMRISARAARVVWVIDPASLVGVSFQMSFGAVVALIAVYEKWGAQLAHLFHRGSFGHKVLGYC